MSRFRKQSGDFQETRKISGIVFVIMALLSPQLKISVEPDKSVG
jgi:hypothetical protein